MINEGNKLIDHFHMHAQHRAQNLNQQVDPLQTVELFYLFPIHIWSIL